MAHPRIKDMTKNQEPQQPELPWLLQGVVQTIEAKRDSAIKIVEDFMVKQTEKPMKQEVTITWPDVADKTKK
jgi:hypothetical protein